MAFENMTEEEARKLAASIMGKKGAAIRNGSMTREQRSAHGKMMAAARDRNRAARKAREQDNA